MDFNELKDLSIDDIDLILLTQQDLYEPWELKELEAYRDKLLREEHEKSRPEEVVCPKCGGVNESNHTKCKYCAYQFKEKDYFHKEETCDGAQKRGGTLWIVTGTILLLVGIFMNNSVEIHREIYWEYGVSNPGTPLIAVGVVVTLVGLIKMLTGANRT